MDILLGKIKPAEKKQTLKRVAFFLITRNQWGNREKEVPRK
jgi:hypothetical protein